MSYYYITFRSVTYAQRGERVLQAGKIRCTLQRTPRWMEEQGCGYCLRLWTKELAPAAELLAREGVLTIFLDNRVRVVSSTEIREKLRCGLPCHDLPDGVGEYIAAHGLYKGEKR